MLACKTQHPLPTPSFPQEAPSYSHFTRGVTQEQAEVFEYQVRSRCLPPTSF